MASTSIVDNILLHFIYLLVYKINSYKWNYWIKTILAVNVDRYCEISCIELQRMHQIWLTRSVYESAYFPKPLLMYFQITWPLWKNIYLFIFNVNCIFSLKRISIVSMTTPFTLHLPEIPPLQPWRDPANNFYALSYFSSFSYNLSQLHVYLNKCQYLCMWKCVCTHTRFCYFAWYII